MAPLWQVSPNYRPVPLLILPLTNTSLRWPPFAFPLYFHHFIHTTFFLHLLHPHCILPYLDLSPPIFVFFELLMPPLHISLFIDYILYMYFFSVPYIHVHMSQIVYWYPCASVQLLDSNHSDTQTTVFWCAHLLYSDIPTIAFFIKVSIHHRSDYCIPIILV